MCVESQIFSGHEGEIVTSEDSALLQHDYHLDQLPIAMVRSHLAYGIQPQQFWVPWHYQQEKSFPRYLLHPWEKYPDH